MKKLYTLKLTYALVKNHLVEKLIWDNFYKLAYA